MGEFAVMLLFARILIPALLPFLTASWPYQAYERRGREAWSERALSPASVGDGPYRIAWEPRSPPDRAPKFVRFVAFGCFFVGQFTLPAALFAIYLAATEGAVALLVMAPLLLVAIPMWRNGRRLLTRDGVRLGRLRLEAGAAVLGGSMLLFFPVPALLIPYGALSALQAALLLAAAHTHPELVRPSGSTG